MVGVTRWKLFRRLLEEKGAAQAKEPLQRKGTAIPHNRRRSRAEKKLLLKKKLLVCYTGEHRDIQERLCCTHWERIRGE
jgi:hypothetical protein